MVDKPKLSSVLKIVNMSTHEFYVHESLLHHKLLHHLKDFKGRSKRGNQDVLVKLNNGGWKFLSTALYRRYHEQGQAIHR
jgi:hypothetical protein